MRPAIRHAYWYCIASLILSIVTTCNLAYAGEPVIWKARATTVENGTCLHIVKQWPDQQVVFQGTKGGNIYRSSDGGQTFSIMTLNVTGTKPITDIYFSSPYDGWAVSYDKVYRSTNGGVNWVSLAIPASPAPRWTSLYYNTDTEILLVSSKDGGLLTSTDEGATFEYTSTGPLGGFAFATSTSGIITGYGGPSLYTTDGGVTWKTGQSISCWRPCAVGTVFFSADPFTQEVHRSMDGGATWQLAYSFSSTDSLVGQILGTCEQLFVNTLHRGYYNSIDYGKTWRRIGGPSHKHETTADLVTDYIIASITHKFRERIFTYALDALGYSSLYLEKNLIVIDGSCDKLSDSVKVFALPLYCGSGMQLATVDYSGPSSIIVTYPPLPAKITDSLIIRVRYKMEQPGDVEGRIILRFLSEGVHRDSVINIFARSNGSDVHLLYDKQQMRSDDACTTLFKEITLVSGYCDTAQVEVAALRHGKYFAMDTAFNTDLLAGGSLKFLVRASMGFNGLVRDTLDIRITTPFGLIDTSIALEAVQSSIEKPTVTAVKTDFGRVSQCESKTQALWIENPNCLTTRIDSVVIVDASGSYKLVTDRLPITLVPGQKDSVHILLSPTLAGPLTRIANVHASNDKFTAVTPGTIVGVGVSGTKTTATIEKAALDLGEITTCQSDIDSFTIGHNGGCDSLVVDLIDVQGDAAFSVDVEDWKAVLGTSDAIKVRVKFNPTKLGSSTGAIRVRSRSKQTSEWTETTVPVTARATLDRTAVTFTEPSFNTITICERDSSEIVATNNSCSVRKVDATINGGYTISPTSVMLLPGGSGKFKLYFDPSGPGAAAGSIVWSTTDTQFDVKLDDATTEWKTVVEDGERTLAASTASIDFGESTICEERTSSVTLENTGCDVITITSANIDENFALDATLPITLSPGQTIELPIRTILDTAGRPSELTGTLVIGSNADNAIAPIALTRSLIYPAKLRLEAIDNAKGSAGDIAHFKVILEGDVPRSVTSLDFDLLHNNDLLGYEGLTGAGVAIITTTGETQQRQRVRVSPVRSGVLCELSFKAYMASQATTTLAFENIGVEIGGASYPSECAATVDDSSASFEYVYVCGDEKLQQLLRVESLIKRITPNPASEHIQLELAEGFEDAELTIVDMLGRKLVERALSDSTSPDRVDVSKLSTGPYYLRVVAGGVVQTKPIVIQR